MYRRGKKYYGSLDKLKLRFVVRAWFKSKEIIGYTWYPSESKPGIFTIQKITSRDQKGLVISNFERYENLINIKNFPMEDPGKVDTGTPCMDV